MDLDMMVPCSMLELVQRQMDRVRTQGGTLIDLSGVHPVNEPEDIVIITSGEFFWNDLPPEGKQVQARLLPDLARLEDLVRVLTQSLPEQAHQSIDSSFRVVGMAVKQQGSHSWADQDAAIHGLSTALDEIKDVLSGYFAGDGTTLAIPDTNALLWNPDLEKWRFDGVASFEFVLTPTVLSELDDHKVNHRNEQVREKAEQIIRRIKEYRRRGSLQAGVPLVSGAVSLRSIAMEPDMTQTLSWFDASNADDCFLATSLQVMSENMGSAIFVVTRDINMQNKAEFAGIPFVEPPSLAKKGDDDAELQ